MKIFVILLILVGSAMLAPNAFALCPQNEDWSDRPCYAPFFDGGIEKEKRDWAPYYDFKGSEWMELKKQEMTQAIQNDTLSDWIELTSKTQAHQNVHEYYFLLGEVPNLDGGFIDESYKPLDTIEKYQFINFSYKNTIGEPIKFILEKIRDNNCNSYNAKITDKDGTFVWGGGADIDCSSASISSSIPYQTKIGYNESHPIVINDSGKYYLEVEFDDVFIKREFIVRQNYSGANLDDINYLDSREFLSPLKQIQSGIAIDKIRCNEGLKLIYKYNQMPTCVKPESIPKLAERGWISETDDHSLLALKKVQDSCANDSPKERMANPLRYSNGTHVFLNLGCEWTKIGVFVGDIEPEPIPEPEPTYTLTEVNCFTNQVIYNDECVYVLIPTDEFPKDMTKYFSIIDDVIVNFCEIKPATVSDGENNSSNTLDRCFEISHYTISDVNEIEFQSTTPPTWINIKLENLTRNVELGFSPTFTVVESGWGNGCTSPTLEVYRMTQEIGNDYTSDDLMYKHRIVYSCPYYEPIYPPQDVLRIWDESDFTNFPICEEEGKYLIIGDSGYERLALDYYYCGLENEK